MKKAEKKEIQKQIDAVWKEIRDFEMKIRKAPLEVRNQYKTDVRKLRIKVRLLQDDLDSR